MTKEDLDKRENLNYGSVRITRGKYKGKIGYYDDQEGAWALVYIGNPFSDNLQLLHFNQIEPIISPKEHREWIEKNPYQAAFARIEIRDIEINPSKDN